jgi:hypothetical protein
MKQAPMKNRFGQMFIERHASNSSKHFLKNLQKEVDEENEKCLNRNFPAHDESH